MRLNDKVTLVIEEDTHYNPFEPQESKKNKVTMRAFVSDISSERTNRSYGKVILNAKLIHFNKIIKEQPTYILHEGKRYNIIERNDNKKTNFIVQRDNKGGQL